LFGLLGGIGLVDAKEVDPEVMILLVRRIKIGY
jgi:hypothetical protein